MALLLFASVLLVCSFGAWRWKPYGAEIIVCATGIRLKAWGRAPVPETVLSWDDIARIDHRVVTRFRAHDLRLLVFVTGSDTTGRVREYAIVADGLEDDFSTVMRAIDEAASENGWRLTGPRIDHLATWFHGLNWRLERMSQV